MATLSARTAVQRLPSIVLLAAIVLAGVAWVVLRHNLDAGLTTAAQRDLLTIADLVAADLERLGADRPELRGEALASHAATDARLAGSLQRASRERFRTVYFFDDAGRIVGAPGTDTPTAPAAPAIVRQALARLAQAPEDTSGAVSEPYRDADDEEVIGAWRWLPGRRLGVVAERPYVRFASPIESVDQVFGALLTLLVGAAFVLNFRSPRELLEAFRGSDLRRCGPYRIERLVGEGAMSNVYLARHERLGRRVALKRLKIQTQSDELSARFDREARLAARLAHPNIVTVLDHGSLPDGGFYYAMEFIDGMTLTQWVEQHGPLPPARVVRLLAQVTAAVGAMHAAGLLHRDIKPDNVMAYAAHGDYDLVKLLDFGLIKDLEAHATRDLTRNVRILGTPAYMAPERLLDPANIDPRTDLYGIGCVAYFLLSGHKPFEATQDADLAQQVLHVEAPAVGPHSPFPIPDALAELVAACLAKDPARRPADTAELAARLDRIAALVPWQKARARLWWASVAPEPPQKGGSFQS